jgi:hypothetical protein
LTVASVPARQLQTAIASGTSRIGAVYQALVASGRPLITTMAAATVIAALYRNLTRACISPSSHPVGRVPLSHPVGRVPRPSAGG